MITKTAPLSRRTTLLAGVGFALGAAATRVLAQQAAEDKRVPENETYWARMGVSLAGKTVLVTGSTDGLGKEVARQLGALGAFVIVHGRNQERGEEVVRTIKSAGVGDAAFHRADLASLAGVGALAEKIMETYDRLDVLVNNAAAVSGDEVNRLAIGGERKAQFALAEREKAPRRDGGAGGNNELVGRRIIREHAAAEVHRQRAVIEEFDEVLLGFIRVREDFVDEHGTLRVNRETVVSTRRSSHAVTRRPGARIAFTVGGPR